MTTILLTIHIMIAVALVGVVLLQRSEGGALGIGGGSGGGFMTARGTANLLTRITTFLAAAFFLTSIGLAILAGNGRQSTSIVDVPCMTSERVKPIPPETVRSPVIDKLPSTSPPFPRSWGLEAPIGLNI